LVRRRDRLRLNLRDFRNFGNFHRRLRLKCSLKAFISRLRGLGRLNYRAHVLPHPGNRLVSRRPFDYGRRGIPGDNHSGNRF
jgi:hypothetical protein